MKHLKTYEKLSQKYKVGDYVLLKMIHSEIPFISGEPTLYTFELSTKDTLWGNEYLVRRKLSKEEIETYKVRYSANTYNL
jgi:hypothetical protein